MKNENIKLIKSYQALFDATMNPVFGTILMYMKRTGNTITLDGVGLEKQNIEDLTL